jgi:hypothetical protein
VDSKLPNDTQKHSEEEEEKEKKKKKALLSRTEADS